jgi:hypothetical protein
MITANFTGDFASRSSKITDVRVSWTRTSKDSPSELIISGDESLKSFAQETKTFILNRMRSSNYQRAIDEKNIDVNELCVYLMPFLVPVGEESDLPKYFHSHIMENINIDCYENTMFVFRNSDKSVLFEVWIGYNSAKTAIYQETAAPGYFQYNELNQKLEEEMRGLNTMDYWDVRKKWIRRELDRIVNAILKDDDAMVLSL